MSVCRSCGEEILWARTVNNRSMPVDARPRPDGNVVIEVRRRIGHVAHVIVNDGLPAGVTLLAGRDNVPLRYMPHFATCPAQKRPPPGPPALRVVR